MVDCATSGDTIPNAAAMDSFRADFFPPGIFHLLLVFYLFPFV